MIWSMGLLLGVLIVRGSDPYLYWGVETCGYVLFRLVICVAANLRLLFVIMEKMRKDERSATTLSDNVDEILTWWRKFCPTQIWPICKYKSKTNIGQN